MTDDLTNLVTYRGRLKGSLTRCLAYAENPPEDCAFESVTARIERLEVVWKEFVRSTDDIYKFRKSAEFSDPEEDFAIYEEKYLAARGKLYTLRYKYTLQELPPSEDVIERLANQQATFLEKFATVTYPKENDLPKINIPSFSGSYKDWPSFKDIFENSVHLKPGLSNIQKFHYLKSVLKDDAAKLIQHVPITDSAYQAIWVRLNDRYDRPKHIIHSFIETFMSLPSTGVENVLILRKIADGANEVVRGLDSIGQEQRDCWLIYLLLLKVDPETRSRWIHESKNNPIPTISDFFDFLDSHCEELELSNRKSMAQSKSTGNIRSFNTHSKCLVSVNQTPRVCYHCKSSEHSLYRCPKYTQLSVADRREFVKSASLCFNCLRRGHSVSKCSSKSSCKDCKKRHHSSLHENSTHMPPTCQTTAPSASTDSAVPSTPSTSASGTMEQYPLPWSTTANVVNPVLLAPSFDCQPNLEYIMPTAVILVKASIGQFVECRALLDTASKLSFITEGCARRLGLQRSDSHILVSGISSIKAETTRGSCKVFIKSRISEHSLNAVVHVLSTITTNLPNYSYKNNLQEQISDLDLADPSYNTSAPIDILFGLQHIWDIFTFDRRLDSDGRTIAVSSIFGWVVTCATTMQVSNNTSALITTFDIDRTLKTFWEIEEANYKHETDPVDALVESHFLKTHSRHSDGKYIVNLPFKQENQTFGNTLSGALCRFYAVEKRLQRNAHLRAQYIQFMREYIKLNHMREVSNENIQVANGKVFYLPHHPVIGEKIRVVFDGSYADSNGASLNNTLYIGPSIQRDLFSVCLRFRFHRFVFSADIVKMFRQIWITERHRNYQRILWRESPSEPVRHYQLCTVTYGTSCAPYLSVRVLEQLAHDYKEKHQKATQVLLEDFYVDDVLTGGATEAEIVSLKKELETLLSYAGFELRKWVSNSPSISKENHDHSFFKSPDRDVKKILGIYWNPNLDGLGYKIQLKTKADPTKRQVLSDVSRIFDPMGFLAPVVVNFKTLLREIWSSNLAWDEPLPEDLSSWWTSCRNDLSSLQELNIPRFIINHSFSLELHGFSDASIRAYSAVVYARFIDEHGISNVSLLAAKTRVAPIKQKSLPRLELCGALLLSRLLKRIKDAIPHKQLTIRAWCDSTIVLSWLSQPPIKLKTFEGNRTAEIIDTVPNDLWQHVPSKDNPADCASRGMLGKNLINFELWWKGPPWLRNNEIYEIMINRSKNFNILSEPSAMSALKSKTTTMVTSEGSFDCIHHLSLRVSKWHKMIRIVGYVFRYIHKIRHKSNAYGNLTFIEIEAARLYLLKHAQKPFTNEITSLRNNELISSKSKLLKLYPFLDSCNILRVGGRLRNSDLDTNLQHPIILPKQSRITHLILDDLHQRNLHPGVSALFVIARQSYWIIGARNLIRSLTHKCIRCFRQRQRLSHQIMADLPRVRVRQAFPFENTGCDYAGPFTLKMYSGRNARKSKGYICLFVCMVTSAIHIELVSDLTTEGFLAALRRFTSRRGKCREIFSDNGTNFQGASTELNEMFKVIRSQSHNEVKTLSLAEDGIKWSYIPPCSPHWGGIWESAVRSVKLHLKRVIMNTELTFEQMHTLLAQIEAVVNSRPLGAAPDTECDYLSPAHFLIGRPYTTVPEGALLDLQPNKLSYWQHVQNMFQGFWQKWHQEYLTSLQQRPKWNQPQSNISTGTIVAVKERKLPPSKWLIARVIETCPGDDGRVRVVKLKTKTGEIIRTITSIVPLPIF